MTDKDLYRSFNEISYTDKELDEYNKPVVEKDKIISFQWIMRRRIAFSVLLPKIKEELTDGEEILYYMSAEDSSAKVYQAFSAIATGIGLLPMLSFGVENVIVATNKRLMQAILKFDLEIDRILSYEYADIEAIGTAYLYRGKEMKRLFIKFKDKNRAICFFSARQDDYTKFIEIAKANCGSIMIESCDGDFQKKLNRNERIRVIVTAIIIIYIVLMLFTTLPSF